MSSPKSLSVGSFFCISLCLSRSYSGLLNRNLNQINFSTAGISSAYGIMTPLTFLLLGKYLSVQLYEASGRERVWAWEATLAGQGRKILHFQDHVLLNLIWRLDVCQAPASQLYGILQARTLEWVPVPSPGDLPNTGIEPRSPILQANSLPSEPPGVDSY